MEDNPKAIFLSKLRSNANVVTKLPKQIPFNFVLVKPTLLYEKETDSGILMLPDPDFTSKDSTGVEINMADHAPRYGKVILLPDELYFNPKLYGTDMTKNTLEWDTEIEIQEGDDVWFSYLKGVTGEHYIFNGELYYLMRYDSIYAIKKKEYPVPINGFIVFEPIKDEWDSDIIIPPDYIDVYEDRVGRVLKVSKPNKDYVYRTSRGEQMVHDNIEVKEGDICLFDGTVGAHRMYLEGKTFQEYPERYFLFQRRDIGLIY